MNIVVLSNNTDWSASNQIDRILEPFTEFLAIAQACDNEKKFYVLTWLLSPDFEDFCLTLKNNNLNFTWFRFKKELLFDDESIFLLNLMGLNINGTITIR